MGIGAGVVGVVGTVGRVGRPGRGRGRGNHGGWCQPLLLATATAASAARAVVMARRRWVRCMMGFLPRKGCFVLENRVCIWCLADVGGWLGLGDMAL